MNYQNNTRKQMQIGRQSKAAHNSTYNKLAGDAAVLEFSAFL